jgi:hypothetical protein
MLPFWRTGGGGYPKRNRFPRFSFRNVVSKTSCCNRFSAQAANWGRNRFSCGSEVWRRGGAEMGVTNRSRTLPTRLLSCHGRRLWKEEIKALREPKPVTTQQIGQPSVLGPEVYLVSGAFRALCRRLRASTGLIQKLERPMPFRRHVLRWFAIAGTLVRSCDRRRPP